MAYPDDLTVVILLPFALRTVVDHLQTADEAACLAPGKSVTYEYYQKHIKTAAPPPASGWVCTVCGHVLQSETLPEDYVCPICKHGAADFVRVK